MSEVDHFIKLFGDKSSEMRQAQLRWATCKSVNWKTRTMVAVGQSDDLEYYDVMLGLQAMAIKPKENALCLLAVLEGEDAATFLLSASEIEEIVWTSTGGNLQIGNGTVSLYSLMNDLLNIITNLKVHTPSGASVGLLPDTKIALKKFETNFKQLLKDG